MKKCFLMAVFAAGMMSFASSQNFGVEISLQNPFRNQDFFLTNGLSVRYFIADKMVIRGSLTLGSTSDSWKTYQNGGLFSTDKTSSFALGLLPGFEYHFAKYTKVSVFAGARIGANFLSSSTSTKYAESSFGTNQKTSRSGFGFQAGVFTGVDFNLTANLYIGAEIGLDYNANWYGRDKITVGTTTTKGNFAYSDDNLGIAVTPALRLGWKF